MTGHRAGHGWSGNFASPQFRLRPLARFIAVALAAMASPLFAGPVGEQVVAGQVTVTRPDGQQTLIQQGSQKAVINWQNFDVGAGEAVHFAQPSPSSVALNRVVGQSPTEILGVLTANGQIFLLNPNGVLFGDSAQVSVGGLVVTTLQLSDEDFLAGRVQLVNGGTAGEVRNAGQISADGGYVVLAAPQVDNDGRIAASDVALAAGDKINLQLDGSRLVSVRIDAGALNAVAQNRGLIRADGGQVLLTAKAADQLIKSVVNNSGVVEAATLSNVGGRIRLEGDEVTSSGTLSARGEGGQRGGSVEMLGNRVALLDGAVVDVSGDSGGGAALVGGDYQGKNNEIRNAERTHVASTASINADARDSGDGGRVIVWADGDTRYLGSISARGGDNGGDGGFVEVSGKQYLDMHGHIDVAAPQGEGGTVLLDPQDIVLNTSPQASPPSNANGTPDVAFATAPAAGTYTIQINDVRGYSELYLQASRDITLASSLSMNGGNSVRFEAGNTIAINAPLTARGGVDLSAANVTSTTAGSITASGVGNGNAGNITINATNNVSLAGAVTATGGAASTNNSGRNGGAINITGGSVALGAVTASGSNGNGAAQAGGAGGSINITATNGITGTGAITASGGNGSTSAANGGAAGTITINNGGAGDISVGALTARNGNAVTTGVDGAVGSIAVSNSAVASGVTTGAINTSGATKGHGGSINLSALGALSTGNITSAGGTTITGNAGRNAGTITLAGDSVSTGTISASGGAGLGTNQAGGDAAAVSISSNGALTTGAITVRAGAATGTGVGGASAPVTLVGGSVATGALSTAGNANGNGGDIAVTTTVGDINLGTVSAAGGTAISGNAGRNAGSVTLTSVGAITTSTITASGSAGLGTNQAGGNAGAVSITGDGTLTTAAITARAGAATGTGAGGAVAQITLAGSSVTAGALSAAGNANGHGGSIDVTSTAGSISVGTVSTAGGTAISGNAGRNAGSVTFDSAGAITVSTITASGSAGVGASQSGGAGGAVNIAAAEAITVAAITASGGGVGTSGNANGGAGGSVVLDAGGAAPTINLGGAISTAGGARRGTGVAGAGGSFWAKDATTNTLNVAVNTAGGSGGGVGGAIRFDGALNEDATARTLTLTAGTGAITLAGGTPTNALTRLTATGASNTLGSITTKGAQSYTGAISLNGALTTTGSASTDTVALNSPVTLTGNSSITTAGGSGDNIAITQTVNGNFNFLLDAGLLGNVTTNAVIGGITPLNGFSASGANVTLGRSVTANSIFARATSGDLTLNTAGTVLRGTGTGNAVELVADGASGRFINNVGAAAINASDDAGRFLIWSQESSSDVRGGLGVTFKQYAATYGVATVADSNANNNGFLYATAPVITVDLIGSTSKTYDGSVVAALTSGNYSISGVVEGDTVVVNTPLVGSYADKHVGSGTAVSADGLAIDSASNGALTVYGYTLASTSATADIGTISQRALTVTAAADSKSYDGSISSSAAPTHAALQSGDAAAFTQHFDNRNVGTGKTLVVSGVVDDGNGGANYSYTFVDISAGEVSPATIRGVTGIAASDKLYDGTTDVLLNTDAALFDGIVGADVLLVSAATGHFIDRNAGNAKAVVIRDITLAGPDAGNYLLADDTATTTASIGARAITVTAADSTKIYGDADPLLGFGVDGLVAGDSVVDVFNGSLLRATGEDVAGGPYAINQGTLVTNDNYVVATFTPGQLTITPRALTIRADDKAKFAAAPLPEFSATYTGFAFADDPSSLSGALAFATAADVESVPGLYAITPYGQSSGNYTITYVDGALHVFAGGVRAVDQVLSAIYAGSDWLPLVADVEPDAMGHSAVVGCSSISATMSCSSTVYGDGNTRLTIVNGGVRLPAKLAL